MSKSKATLEAIIVKKKQGDMDKLQVKFYESKTLDMKIEVRKIPLSRYMKLVETVEEGNSLDGMNELIFECCPLFRENTKEAMEIYGVAEPTELPLAVLEDQMNEANEIIELINTFYGIDKMKADVKN